MSNNNTMGNLLLITGENVKEKISRYFRAMEEGGEEIIFDFAKVLPLENVEDIGERQARWGANENADNAQFHAAKKNDPTDLIPDKLYFNSTAVVPKIIERLAQLYPEWDIDYIYADDWAETVGCYTYRKGAQVEHEEMPYRSVEAIDHFSWIWGRRDNFTWCNLLKRYVGEDESPAMRLLPRIEKDFDEYHRTEMKRPKTEIFNNSFKNGFILEMKNYLTGILENDEWAERLLKCKENILLGLYAYKMNNVGTSEDVEDKEYVCEGWLEQQKRAEFEM